VAKDENLRTAIDDHLKMAIEKGAAPSPLPRVEPPAVTSEDFQVCLSRFATFVKSDMRMTFWRKDGKKHKWIERPEKHAQNLLRTHLSASFSDRVEVLEEVGAGAGRIDLYVVCHGGLRFIVELKMLGAGYSTSYAFSGTEQIVHYMENKKTHLGFLVTFDARVRENGTGLNGSEAVGTFTVRTLLVDVRPMTKNSAG
jgi:hypothetical protein